MKRTLPALVACTLLIAAAPLAAQTAAPEPQKPAAAPAPEAKPPARVLNLQLDDSSRRQIMSGSQAHETNRSGPPLPSLGEDARPLPQERGRLSPYPKDVERARDRGD